MKDRTFIPIRYLIIVGTFLLTLLLYIDRICISVAKDSLASDLGMSDKQMGWILSAFALGYALFQTPSGMMADRFGPRKILTAIVTFWSVFTALTGVAWNFISLFFTRLFFGIGEAGAFPGISRAVFSWIPLKERGFVTGINFSGSRLGAAFALPVVALMIQSFGWRISFLILAAAGFIWALIWYLWFRDEPVGHPGISGREVIYINENVQKAGIQEKGEGISFVTIIRSKNMWLTMLQYFCSNFTFFFCLTWMFPHIREQYNLDAVNAGLWASIPLIMGAVGNWFSGWLVDRIFRNGHWIRSRRIPAIIGFALAAIGMAGSVYSSDVISAVLFLSLAIFGADMTLSPSWSLCVDIGRKNAGAVSGTMNMAGNLGSFVTALAFPYLRAWTGSVTPFFLIGSGLNILAIVFWKFMRPDKPIEEL